MDEFVSEIWEAWSINRCYVYHIVYLKRAIGRYQSKLSQIPSEQQDGRSSAKVRYLSNLRYVKRTSKSRIVESNSFEGLNGPIH